MWPMWMPNVIDMRGSLLERRIDANVDEGRAATLERAAHGGADVGRLLHALAGDPERAREPDVIDQRLVQIHRDVGVVLGREALERLRALLEDPIRCIVEDDVDDRD